MRFGLYGRGYARLDLGFMAGVMLGEIWDLWQGLCYVRFRVYGTGYVR